MGWNDIADNQTVSYANLQDAVNLGYFTLSTALPTPSNKQTTKAVALQCLNGINTSYPLFAERFSNQLITKESIFIGGDFILDPQYGKVITSMTGTNLPTFTYNVTSITTKTYNAIIPAQTITVGVSGNAFVTPVRLTLTIDSYIVVDDKALVNNGSDTINLVLPFAVSSPSTIAIRVNSGVVPGPPPAPALQGVPFTAVSVNRGSGQYMAAGGGRAVPFTKGYIYTSSDYGANWIQRSPYGYWRNISHSHDGQYLLAVPSYGKAYKSSNYGAGWTEITNLPAPEAGLTPIQDLRFTAAAISSNGQYQILVHTPVVYSDNLDYSRIFVSSDYGVTWTARRVQTSYSYQNAAYSSVAISDNGTNILVGIGGMFSAYGYTEIWKSTNYGANWSLKSFASAGNPVSLDMLANGSAAMVTRYSGQVYPRSYKSLDSGETWSEISGGGSLSQDLWRDNAVYFKNGNPQAYALIHGTSTQIRYIDNLTTVSSTSTSLFKDWRSISTDNTGTYVLAGSTSSMYRSIDGGASWLLIT